MGRLEVEKRGTQVDPLQRQLPGQEAGQATLLLAGTSAGVTAVLAQRKSPEATERPSRGFTGLQRLLPGRSDCWFSQFTSRCRQV